MVLRVRRRRDIGGFCIWNLRRGSCRVGWFFTQTHHDFGLSMAVLNSILATGTNTNAEMSHHHRRRETGVKSIATIVIVSGVLLLAAYTGILSELRHMV